MFFAASLPNLVLGPIAGTFVDRWDHQEVMVVSDLLRAALVLLIPLAAVTNFVLVYPMLFLITSISLFFRPARTAIMPADRPLERPARGQLGDLDRARRSRTSAAIRWPAIFVAFLGEALPLAFWLDAVSVRRLGRRSSARWPSGAPATGRRGRRRRRGRDEAGPEPDFRRELLEGWHFLRHETVLLANTLQGVVGQFALGATIAITALYATRLAGSRRRPGDGGLRLPRDRRRRRQPRSAGSSSASSARVSPRAGWSSSATRSGGSASPRSG